jgi:hypothetical protein
MYRTTQKLGRVRAVPRPCKLYPGICITTEEKARKSLSQGSHTLTYSKTGMNPYILNIMKIEIFRQISENPQMLYFMKIRPVATDLFHVDRQT